MLLWKQKYWELNVLYSDKCVLLPSDSFSLRLPTPAIDPLHTKSYQVTIKE